jgi:hypothetical protein
VHREVLLADRVQRRDQRDQERGVADGEQGAAAAVQLTRVPPFGQAAIADDIGDPDAEQREDQQRVGGKLRERRG